MAEIIRKRMIPWEGGSWGRRPRYSNHERVAYPVGSREDAEREPLQPDPNPVGDDTGLLVCAE